jgi:indolepyruvate ferredoxin oxidoreductase alpha subunit
MNTKHFKLLSGNEALAQGAFEAGLKFAGSYPGTPATEILEYLTQFKEVDAQWSVNEKVAFEVALEIFCRIRSLYSFKNIRHNLAMDPLMTAAYSGINAGFVIVTATIGLILLKTNKQPSYCKVCKKVLCLNRILL